METGTEITQVVILQMIVQASQVILGRMEPLGALTATLTDGLTKMIPTSMMLRSGLIWMGMDLEITLEEQRLTLARDKLEIHQTETD
jgi:hypothetical protein